MHLKLWDNKHNLWESYSCMKETKIVWYTVNSQLWNTKSQIIRNKAEIELKLQL